MEDVANEIVYYLRDHFAAERSGDRQVALARFFLTQPYGRLTSDLRRWVHRTQGRQPAEHVKCLTMLATAGDRPAWCAPSLSVHHRAIPHIDDKATRARVPMIASIVEHFGWDLTQTSEEEQPSWRSRDPGSDPTLMFDVFHVADVPGSSYVPAQRDFVAPERIQSCLGFGGALPGGEVFAVILFSRSRISKASTATFKPLPLSIKIALLPFETRVFRKPLIAEEAPER
jgi:hypothetical protein